MERQINVLIVEDEERLAAILRMQLEEVGFRVKIAVDGYHAKRMIEENSFNLILLDIHLPFINGYDLCQEIRSVNQDIPIIMITALGTNEQKLIGFQVGADDYIVKPYEFNELHARINVFLRRSDNTVKPNIICVSDLVINADQRTASRGGKSIILTAKEYSLLEYLVQNFGKVLGRDEIIEKVWGIDFDPGTNIIDVYINYLRKKIDKDYPTKLIHTKFGFGFYMAENEI
ncbi:MAG: response regulator transcription factor [Bacteroidales bacterium]|nr:response regulator transcription factor [Bacteroidales bacterium]